MSGRAWRACCGLTDDEEAALPLPRSHGEDDFTLVLQDRRFDADGQMPYAMTMHDRMAGMQGDVMLVNGQTGPVLEVDAPLIRLRILNGANGTFYGLHFADTRTFHQIASDGGLLAAPVPMQGAILSPGERGGVSRRCLGRRGGDAEGGNLRRRGRDDGHHAARAT